MYNSSYVSLFKVELLILSEMKDKLITFINIVFH